MAGGGGGAAAEEAGPGERQLDQTPTWAVGLVCAVIVIISVLLEKLLHYIGHVTLYSAAITYFVNY